MKKERITWQRSSDLPHLRRKKENEKKEYKKYAAKRRGNPILPSHFLPGFSLFVSFYACFYITLPRGGSVEMQPNFVFYSTEAMPKNFSEDISDTGWAINFIFFAHNELLSKCDKKFKYLDVRGKFQGVFGENFVCVFVIGS